MATTTTERIQSATSISNESGSNRLQVPLTSILQSPQADVQSIHTYHSGDIKSPLCRFRNKASPLASDYVKLPREAEEYLAHNRLLLAAAKSKINVANDKAIQEKFQEYRLLLQITEDGGDIDELDPHMALTLARLARETLASEYDLAVSKRDSCLQELAVLHDAADEAFVFLTDADHQIGEIFNMLVSTHTINIPKHPLSFSFPNPTLEEPDHLFHSSKEGEGKSSPLEDSSDARNGDGGNRTSMKASSPGSTTVPSISTPTPTLSAVALI